MASKDGIAADTIWRIEGGRQGPDMHLTTMKKIADALGVHPSEIAEFVPGHSAEERPQE